ncbi:activator of stress genes 5 [Chaetomidium leptoderma]|uniref:Activator of stress genes 5 n=1 Tax=Chaetomidium leptoderma TaxID=669021 RepID=A0AAN6ZVL8_9PEZI|nr:activator of stress genes 5 [Chaetomidium leptoderma]
MDQDATVTIDAQPRPSKRRRGWELAGSFSASASPPAAVDESGAPKPRKAKVSRACDQCKSRKAKCSGTEPCDTCFRKGRECQYRAEYLRGRPPTPPPMSGLSAATAGPQQSVQPAPAMAAPRPRRGTVPPRAAVPEPDRTARHQERSGADHIPSSRASPVLGVTEIQGQVLDPTSGLTFLHRAWKRLSRPNGQPHNDDGAGMVPHAGNYSAEEQPIFAAGDRPLPSDSMNCEGVHVRSWFPEQARARELLALYFDVCIATYRIIHRPTVENWLDAGERNLAHGRPLHHGIGRAKATILLTALAIATTHHEKSRGFHTADDEERSLARSDRLFCEGTRLSAEEKGLPRLESAQARLIQVLYLLTTSRLNRGWYVFGEALQIISALGLHHRRANRKLQLAPGHHAAADYIQSQCRKRTFWTAYILDHYLGIILGRPRHYHDEDIDQDFPDAINDEDMQPDAASSRVDSNLDSHLEALIFHAKIAQIIGKITREVYTIRPISEQERVSAAHRLCERLHSWKASLPPHLGAVRPSSLIPSFRRQCIVLRIAYSHAVMHANRFFLLGNFSSGSSSERQVAECVMAAKTVLEIVDGLARDSPIFHAFWWTHYVTFCALVVTYAWEIQQQTQCGGPSLGGTKTPPFDRAALLDLAERCQMHLAQATATNSPSRRYAIILEELRSEAQRQSGRDLIASHSGITAPAAVEREGLGEDQPLILPGEQQAQSYRVGGEMGVQEFQPTMLHPGDGFESLPGNPVFEAWNMTDWLELDSSAFGPYMDFYDSSIPWLPSPVDG